MTDQLYLDDSTVRSFEATVERTLDDRVVLDRTHFYPEGGGQPADCGRIEADSRALDVTDVQKQDTIYHHVDGEPPAEGTTVRGDLDWERRHAHMRYHTAQHLLSAVLLDEFDAPTVGNQLYDDRARIDIGHSRFTDTDLADLEARLNGCIEADMTVDWTTMDRERAEATLDPERTRIDLLPDSISELRIVEIRGGEDVFDRTACAGTHVRRTDELGEFVVTGRKSRGSDAERIRFTLA